MSLFHSLVHTDVRPFIMQYLRSLLGDCLPTTKFYRFSGDTSHRPCHQRSVRLQLY